jgi:hypothetical protein
VHPPAPAADTCSSQGRTSSSNWSPYGVSCSDEITGARMQGSILRQLRSLVSCRRSRGGSSRRPKRVREDMQTTAVQDADDIVSAARREAVRLVRAQPGLHAAVPAAATECSAAVSVWHMSLASHLAGYVWTPAGYAIFACTYLSTCWLRCHTSHVHLAAGCIPNCFVTART